MKEKGKKKKRGGGSNLALALSLGRVTCHHLCDSFIFPPPFRQLLHFTSPLFIAPVLDIRWCISGEWGQREGVKRGEGVIIEIGYIFSLLFDVMRVSEGETRGDDGETSSLSQICKHAGLAPQT